MQPFHERALNGLRDVADALAFLLAPLQAYDAAHEIEDEEETNA